MNDPGTRLDRINEHELRKDGQIVCISDGLVSSIVDPLTIREMIRSVMRMPVLMACGLWTIYSLEDI